MSNASLENCAKDDFVADSLQKEEAYCGNQTCRDNAQSGRRGVGHSDL